MDAQADIKAAGQSYPKWRDLLFSLRFNTSDGVASEKIAEARIHAGRVLDAFTTRAPAKAQKLFWMENKARVKALDEGQPVGLNSAKHLASLINAVRFHDQMPEELQSEVRKFMPGRGMESYTGLGQLYNLPKERWVEAFGYLKKATSTSAGTSYSNAKAVTRFILLSLFEEEALEFLATDVTGDAYALTECASRPGQHKIVARKLQRRFKLSAPASKNLLDALIGMEPDKAQARVAELRAKRAEEAKADDERAMDAILSLDPVEKDAVLKDLADAMVGRLQETSGK